MSVAAKHSAAGSAAGFEHQRQLALVLLCEGYLRDPSVKVRLEAVEDIELSYDSQATAQIQVKHHLEDSVLTDLTPELWRTLGNWMDLVVGQAVKDWPQLLLATTAKAQPNSAGAHLRPADRNIESALAALLAAAQQSTNAETQASRERFRKLPESIQRSLLDRIVVLDATVQVTGLESRLRKALRLVLPRTQVERFLERLQGWWVNRSARLLKGELPFVTGAELEGFCRSLRDEFGREALVTHDELKTDPTDAEKQPFQGREFVNQLRLVDASAEVIDLAIRHYYRAYAQRGRWARELDDLDEEIQDYEDHLRDEWEIAHVALRGRIGPDETERKREGQKLCLELGGRVTARLRGLNEPVLSYGTLHGLADVQKVGWHPDFRQLLEKGQEET